jgi:hypothetical protein
VVLLKEISSKDSVSDFGMVRKGVSFLSTVLLTICSFVKGNRLEGQRWSCVVCFCKVVPFLNAPFVTTCSLVEGKHPRGQSWCSLAWFANVIYLKHVDVGNMCFCVIGQCSCSLVWFAKLFYIKTLLLTICDFAKGSHLGTVLVLYGLLYKVFPC